MYQSHGSEHSAKLGDVNRVITRIKCCDQIIHRPVSVPNVARHFVLCIDAVLLISHHSKMIPENNTAVRRPEELKIRINPSVS